MDGEKRRLKVEEGERQLEIECINIVFFSSRRRHTRYWRDWSSDVCSSDLRSTDKIERGCPSYFGERGAPCLSWHTGVVARLFGRRIVLCEHTANWEELVTRKQADRKSAV